MALSRYSQYKIIIALDSKKHQGLRTGDALSLAGLNVVLQSDLSNFSAASKARVGRITGIADPLFGMLEGWGLLSESLCHA